MKLERLIVQEQVDAAFADVDEQKIQQTAFAIMPRATHSEVGLTHEWNDWKLKGRHVCILTD
jgi:hypothetical protein